MLNQTLKSCLIPVCLFLATPVSSADPQWQVIPSVMGPKSLAVDTAGVVYAGGPEAIFSSGDGGVTWQVVTDDSSMIDCFAIAVNPVSNHLFVAVESGVYRSTNGGVNWQKVGISAVGAYTLGFRDDGLMIAAGSGGVVRSIDEGITWTQVLAATGPLGNNLAFAGNGTIFIGTLMDGLYRSTNDGDTWQFVGGSFSDPGAVLDVTTDKVNNIVYACDYHLFFNEPTYSKVYRSWDNGDTWNIIDSVSSLTKALFVDSHQNLFVGHWPVSYSTDHGTTWTDLSDGLGPEQEMVRFVEVRPGVLVGASDFLTTLTMPYPPGCCAGNSGNVDGDPADLTDIADLSAIVDHLFFGGTVSGCPDENDVDRSGAVDIADLSALVDYLFFGGMLPGCPW